MLRILKSKKAQVTASEYVVMITLIVAAFTVMTVFINRALQAGIRNSSRGIITKVRREAGNYFNGFLYYQYEPYYLNTASDVTRDIETRSALMQDGISEHTLNSYLSVETESDTAPSKDYKLTGEQ